MPVRLGAVDYLNVRPLVHGLSGRTDVSLRFDVPSVCARLLAEGAIDLGMVPSITYVDRVTDRIVPGVCIGSVGAVASVAIFTRRPMREVGSIALDTSSRTSAALVRILCHRVFEIAPTFAPHAPDLGAMLATADAALLIGDPALFADAGAHQAAKIDLGAVWTDMTGLPFVWAFWSGPAGAADPETVALLQAAAGEGVRHIERIAADYCADDPARIPVAARYLREHLRFEFDEAAAEGLETYFREATAAGVVSGPRPLEFFPG